MPFSPPGSGYKSTLLQQHQGRLLVLSFTKDPDPAVTGTWSCEVGVLGSGGYTFGAAANLSLTPAATAAAQLKSRSDGVVELAYLDGGGSPRVARGRGISQDGVGSWT